MIEQKEQAIEKISQKVQQKSQEIERILRSSVKNLSAHGMSAAEIASILCKPEELIARLIEEMQ